MKGLILYPDEGTRHVSKALSAKLGADAKYMYKTSVRQPLDLSEYENTFVGINMIYDRFPKSLLTFLNTNTEALKGTGYVLFCPKFNADDQKNIQRFSVAILSFVNGYREKDPAAQAAVISMGKYEELAKAISKNTGIGLLDVDQSYQNNMGEVKIMVAFYPNALNLTDGILFGHFSCEVLNLLFALG